MANRIQRVTKHLSAADKAVTLNRVGWRVEHQSYNVIQEAFYQATGTKDTQLKMMLKHFGLVVPPNTNPDIYFVVTSDMLEDDPKPRLVTKFGASPALAMSEEDAKRRFINKVKFNNENR